MDLWRALNGLTERAWLSCVERCQSTGILGQLGQLALGLYVLRPSSRTANILCELLHRKMRENSIYLNIVHHHRIRGVLMENFRHK
jgi:hypothetical protein